MVNLSPFRLVSITQALMMPRNPKNNMIDRSWRKRQIYRMSAHFYGRARNCYSIAIRRVQRALQYVTAGRTLRKEHTKQVWNDRIDAGTKELGYMPEGVTDCMEALSRTEVYLNRKILADLAVWEPRTFKCISMVAATKAKKEEINKFKLGPPPEGVYTRGKL